MSTQEALQQARKERGEQLRALVVSWAENSTFIEALAKQQAKVAAGELTLNEDWNVMADEILGGFLSYNPQQMEWPGDKADDAPKIIVP